MKEFEFTMDEKVLLLGEGNFSFCRDLVSLMKIKLQIEGSGKFTNVYASCFEEESLAIINDDIKEFLIREGVHLMYGIDATDLAKIPTIVKNKFDRIIFNFPHISGKMRMDLNRALLEKFFISAASVLAFDGTVVVSLCEGQGGTPVDKQRRYDDTWKVVENGAAGGFILVGVSPWLAGCLSNYQSSGFRGGKKSFRTEGAILHSFKYVEPLDTHTVPEDLMGYCDVKFHTGLKVPLAYKRLLERDPELWETSVHYLVQCKILDYLPEEYANVGELPLTTSCRLDETQVECRLSNGRAYLRTSFEQVIPDELFRSGKPFYASGVIFRKTDNAFVSYPGSYKMLIAGCDVNKIIVNISCGLNVSLDTSWCKPLQDNVRQLDLDFLSLEMFKTSLYSPKTLWNPRTIVATSDSGYCVSGVSLYPPAFSFDLSFSSNGPLSDEPFLNLMHNLADHLVESVELQSRYSPEGSYAVYHCFRITYKSFDKPLHRSCVVAYQHNAVRFACEKYLDVAVR